MATGTPTGSLLDCAEGGICARSSGCDPFGFRKGLHQSRGGLLRRLCQVRMRIASHVHDYKANTNIVWVTRCCPKRTPNACGYARATVLVPVWCQQDGGNFNEFPGACPSQINVHSHTHRPWAVSRYNTGKKGMAEIKAAGRYRQEGKSYEVQDGDIIHFQFNKGPAKKK